MMFPLGNPANSIKAALGKPPGAFASGLLTVKPIRPVPALFTAIAG
jgi:hypothetical protein